VQDSFLASKPGHITIIYDQSGKGNHLTPAPSGYWPPADTPALATDATIKINGHTVHGVYTNGSFNSSTTDTTGKGVGYRNNNTTGLATGNQAEGMYMVCDGKHYNSACCFDYGNAGKTNIDEGPATMEAINFGNVSGWGHGSGNGPWVLNDCENGLVAGVDTVAGSKNWANNTPIIANYVTGMLKSKNTNFWAIKGCDAATGKLKTMYSGRQFPGWYPKKLSGSIILGIGGDNSHAGVGTFYEGAITNGFPADSIEDSVQANIVAAGYGSVTTSTIRPVAIDRVAESMFGFNYDQSTATAIVSYTLLKSRSLVITIVDQRGRLMATVINGIVPAGRHAAVWNAKRIPSGVYVCRVAMDGMGGFTGKLVVEK
jgi:hypothetical protein